MSSQSKDWTNTTPCVHYSLPISNPCSHNDLLPGMVGQLMFHVNSLSKSSSETIIPSLKSQFSGKFWRGSNKLSRMIPHLHNAQLFESGYLRPCMKKWCAGYTPTLALGHLVWILMMSSVWYHWISTLKGISMCFLKPNDGYPQAFYNLSLCHNKTGCT